MPWRSALAVTTAAALVAGCGGSGSTGSSGREVFARACSVCHTLSGADSPSHQGGDLLAVHLSRAVWVQFARQMPAHPRLTKTQLQAVTDYILAVQRRAR